MDDNAVDLSEDEDFEEETDALENGEKALKEGESGDVLMINSSASLVLLKNKKEKGKGPRLERVLEDDEFIPELKQKNELLQ